MTWGKGGSTNVVQVTTRGRRAISVPAVDMDFEPSIGSKAARTAFSAMDNTDNLSLASKRQDQKLLNDIQMRMENAAFTQPIRREPRSRSRRARRTSVSSVASLPVGGRTQSLADEDYEIFFPEKFSTRQLAPCARRAYHRGFLQRSASLPPTTDDIAARVSTAYRSGGGGTEFISYGSPLLRVVDPLPPRYASAVYALSTEPVRPVASIAPYWYPYRVRPLPKRRYSFAFEAPDDFRLRRDYTPQLGIAQAYNFTLPKPYVRRHVPLQRAPRYYEYDVYTPEGGYAPVPITSSFRASSEPRRPLPTASLAVRQARSSLDRIERELGMGSVSLDDAPYFEEPVVRTSHIEPVTAIRTGWVRSNAPATRRRSYNYGVTSSRPPPAPRSTRLHEIEARLETMMVPEVNSPVSLSNLRSRTSEARNKLDRHKVLLDRYLPIPTGTPNEVPYEIEYKFDELVERMPQLRPREPIYRASSLPPISPVATPTSRPHVNNYDEALRRVPFRPTMSDTRKRAREVLCRTKRDPHYFDY